MKQCVPVLNKAKEISNSQGCFVFPWESTFHSVAVTNKTKQKTAANYPCYLGSCMKLFLETFSLFLFSLALSGEYVYFAFFLPHSNWKLYLKKWKERNILYPALH